MYSIEELNKALDFYKTINLYSNDNEMKSSISENGNFLMEMTILEKHTSSPNTCHGGVIAGFMDSIMGGEALIHAMQENMIVSTIEFKINYLSPVFLGETLSATAVIDYHGKSTIVVSGLIVKKDDQKIVAKAIGTFNKYPLNKRNFSRV